MNDEERMRTLEEALDELARKVEDLSEYVAVVLADLHDDFERLRTRLAFSGEPLPMRTRRRG